MMIYFQTQILLNVYIEMVIKLLFPQRNYITGAI